MRPLIGIPCHPAYRHETYRPIYCNNRAYVHAIEDAGGVPILIPQFQDLSALETILERLDGLLLPGGQDIQPQHYGEEPHPLLGDIDPSIDDLELTLAHWALQENKPIMGICRGMQIMNVARGGSLYQDLPTQRPNTRRHMYQDLPRSQVIHTVRVEVGSQLEDITGEREFWVNSIHHQAIKEAGEGVRIVAYAEDGTPEAIEITDRHFAMALQCHPEEIYQDIPACAQFFSAFVEACKFTTIPMSLPQKQEADATPVDVAIAQIA